MCVCMVYVLPSSASKDWKLLQLEIPVLSSAHDCHRFWYSRTDVITLPANDDTRQKSFANDMPVSSQPAIHIKTPTISVAVDMIYKSNEFKKNTSTEVCKFVRYNDERQYKDQCVRSVSVCLFYAQNFSQSNKTINLRPSYTALKHNVLTKEASCDL